MRRWLVPAFAALAAYVVAALWLTWPLAAVVATHLPTRFGTPADGLHLGWALAHETRALAGAWWTLPHAPAFHPTPYALFYGEAGFGALPFFAPVFLATGNPTLASNVTLLAGVVLTATSLHLVIRRLTGSWLAGLVGGVMFLTTHWVLWSWIAVTPTYAVLFYLPLILLLAAEGMTSARRTAALATLVLLQGLTSIYLAAAAVLPVAVLAVGRALRPATRRDALRLLAALVPAAVVLPVVYAGHLTVRLANPHLKHQTIYALVFQGRINLPWGPFAAGLPMAVSATALALIAVGMLCHLASRTPVREPSLARAWQHGALWFGVGLLFSLTPEASWNGQRVVLPHAWVARWIPAYDALREPGRLGVIGLIGLAVLGGTGFASATRLLDTLRPAGTRRPLRLALAALVLTGLYATYLRGFTIPLMMPFAPLPQERPLERAPRITPALAAALATRPGPLLELPVSGAASHVIAMYRSIFHRRPLLNGYNGYWPTGFAAHMRLACRLPDAAALAALRTTTGVTTILVHLDALDRAAPGPGPYGCPPEMPRSAAWNDAAAGTRSDLRLVGRVDDGLLFAVTP